MLNVHKKMFRIILYIFSYFFVMKQVCVFNIFLLKKMRILGEQLKIVTRKKR